MKPEPGPRTGAVEATHDATAFSQAPTHARGPRRTVPIDSPPSSRRTASAAGAAPVALTAAPIDDAGFEGRYELGPVLGEGGMGEVRRCGDRRIGREVALKLMRGGGAAPAAARARFLREVRVQGQLEHPSVVPVYDLGLTPTGELYFTMKRVRGMTLEEILDGLWHGRQEVVDAYSRRRLLTALSSVCLAVAFAHNRGVIHRDLKPSNVMLGDFGEVHVLDWGVAKIRLEADESRDPVGAPAAMEGGTQATDLLGTPGYMAPEQISAPERVDERADVYALGAILFEVLTLQPMHRGNSFEELISSTVKGRRPPPSERAPDAGIAPDLDAICVRATALDPSQRFASARELHDALERWLEGERNVEQRRQLAQRHLEEAERQLERGGGDAEARRARALRELGAALAIDPSHEHAMRTMVTLLLDGSMPPEAERELDAVAQRDRARAAREAAYSYIGALAIMPLVVMMGVRSWVAFGLFTTHLLLLIAHRLWRSRRHRREGTFELRLWALLTFAWVAAAGIIFGPFILVPPAAVTIATTFMVNMRANRSLRAFVSGCAVAAVCVPACLQWLGVVPPSYLFEDGVMKVLPVLTQFKAGPTMALLTLASLLTVVAGMALMSKAVKTLTTAERRLFAQAWRLRQLLPDTPSHRADRLLRDSTAPPSLDSRRFA
jgi:serine/threonine-protein kinase